MVLGPAATQKMVGPRPRRCLSIDRNIRHRALGLAKLAYDGNDPVSISVGFFPFHVSRRAHLHDTFFFFFF
jgi:hypothetical protein